MAVRAQRDHLLYRPRAAAHQPGPLTWKVNKVLLDDVITVTDDGIVQAGLPDVTDRAVA